MKASKLIESLQARIEMYGDCDVAYWEDGSEVDLEVNDVFADGDVPTIYITNSLAYEKFGLPQG